MQRDLAQKMSSDANTIASLVERMEQAGLVERKTHDKDRRANVLRLLPLGREKYTQAREVAVDFQAEILATLPEDKREEFLEHLALVAEACRTASAKR